MKKLLFLPLFLIAIASSAQDCGCTHYVVTTAKSPVIYDGALQVPPVGPGSVVCLQSEIRGRLTLKNFVGTKENPVIVKNCDGLATIKGDSGATYTPFWFQGCKHLKLTGTGEEGRQYGILVQGGSNGIAFDALSSDIEAEHVEVSFTGFAGFMAKTDPECSKPAGWRENFTMYNVSLHDNYVHDVGGEGFYVGNSFYYTGHPSTKACVINGDTVQKFAHIIDGVDIYNNIVLRTGAEGIQVGSAPKNCKIHDNIIDGTGVSPFANFQNNGLQIGSGTGGLVYNNFIRNSPGNGISCLGIGDNFIFNNIIINSGDGTSSSNSAIFMDEQAHPDSILGSGMKVVNNTIINPRENAFRVYTDRLPTTLIQNNLVVHFGVNPKYVHKLNNSVNIVDKTNLYLNAIPTNLFKDPSTDDYRILLGSIAAGKGSDMLALGFDFDITNTARNAFDIGAFAINAPKLFLPMDSVVTGHIQNSKIEFSFYPNPVKRNLVLEGNSFSSDTKVNLLDTYGRVVFTSNYKSSIDLSFLEKGSYILQLQNETASLSTVIIKE